MTIGRFGHVVSLVTLRSAVAPFGLHVAPLATSGPGDSVMTLTPVETISLVGCAFALFCMMLALCGPFGESK